MMPACLSSLLQRPKSKFVKLFVMNLASIERVSFNKESLEHHRKSHVVFVPALYLLSWDHARVNFTFHLYKVSKIIYKSRIGNWCQFNHMALLTKITNLIPQYKKIIPSELQFLQAV